MLRAFDAWNSILLVLTCHNEDESFQIISLSMDPNLYLYLMTAKLKLHMASLIEKFFHTFTDVSSIHRLCSDYLGEQQTCAASYLIFVIFFTLAKFLEKKIYTAGNKFYTPAGTDGMDKFHL